MGSDGGGALVEAAETEAVLELALRVNADAVVSGLDVADVDVDELKLLSMLPPLKLKWAPLLTAGVGFLL